MKYASKFMLQPSWKLFLIDLGVQPEDVLRGTVANSYR